MKLLRFAPQSPTLLNSSLHLQRRRWITLEYHAMVEEATYGAFAEKHPDAGKLIWRLVSEIGRHGQCGTLNPAIGYLLRQKGMRSVVITAEITCAESPDLQKIEQGYHLWLLVAKHHLVWHVDVANPFLMNIWYHNHLNPEQYEKVSTGKAPGPLVPITPGNFLSMRRAKQVYSYCPADVPCCVFL